MMQNGLNASKLSVVVPIYNVKAYLDKCVESIVTQTYTNLEIILVDDGSTDGSGEKCDLWAARDKRIRVIHKDNGGLVSARQAGVTIATGRYLAQVDADDWIEKDMYADMMERAVMNDADVVTCGLMRDYVTHTILSTEAFAAGVYRKERLEKEFWTQMIDTENFFRSRVNVHITTKIFRADLVGQFQMQLSSEAIVGEDIAVVFPCLLAAKCIVVTGRNYYHYVMRQGSVMDSVQRKGEGVQAVSDILNKTADRCQAKVPNIKKQMDLILLYIRLFSEPDAIFYRGHGGKGLQVEYQLNREDKIVLYGAGRFGKALYKYIEQKKICNIVAWTDKNITETGEGVMTPIETALDMQYDKIVVAVLLADIAEEISEELIFMGVKQEKIAKMKCVTE